MDPELQSEARQPRWLEAVNVGDNGLARLEAAIKHHAETVAFVLQNSLAEEESLAKMPPMEPFGSSEIMLRISCIVHGITKYAHILEELTKRIDV